MNDPFLQGGFKKKKKANCFSFVFGGVFVINFPSSLKSWIPPSVTV